MMKSFMCVILLVAVTAVVGQVKKEEDKKTPGKRGIFSEGYGYSDDISYPVYVNTDVVNRAISVERPASVGYVNTDVVNRAISVQKPVSVGYVNTDVVNRAISVERPASVGYVNTDVVQKISVNHAIPIEKPVLFTPVEVTRVPVEVTRVPAPRRVYVDRPVVLAERAGYPAFAGVEPKYKARYGAGYYGAGGYVANYGAGTSYGRSLHHVDLVGSTQLDSGYVESAGAHAYGYVGAHAHARSYDNGYF